MLKFNYMISTSHINSSKTNFLLCIYIKYFLKDLRGWKIERRIYSKCWKRKSNLGYSNQPDYHLEKKERLQKFSNKPKLKVHQY